MLGSLNTRVTLSTLWIFKKIMISNSKGGPKWNFKFAPSAIVINLGENGISANNNDYCDFFKIIYFILFTYLLFINCLLFIYLFLIRQIIKEFMNVFLLIF